LNDIKAGGNQGCGTPGFRAVEDWVSAPPFASLLLPVVFMSLRRMLLCFYCQRTNVAC